MPRARWWLLALLLYVLVMNAWASDDAFMTYRTARNLWQGHGLTWNPGWRVQAYSHPLWMFVCAAGFAISGECYFSVSALALALALGCGARLLQLAGERRWPVVLLFSASYAAISYAVSGLENSLLFALLIEFVVALRRAGLGQAAWLSAAVGLTRTDALLLVLPGLLVRARSERKVWPLLLGWAPLAAWHLFALVYYGMPFPNTALAKLNVSVQTSTLLLHGLAYLLDSLWHDPLTLLTIGAALWSLRVDGLSRAHAVALALTLLYVVAIGGDFMSGRFLGAPFVFALAALLDAGVEPRFPARTAVALALFAIVWPYGPWWFAIERGVEPRARRWMGIADERGYYYRATGLINVLLDAREIAALDLPTPPHVWAANGRALARSEEPVGMQESVGFYGYFAEDKLVIDGYGLADPLLARIPDCSNDFRVGHCLRALPEGYVVSLRLGRNLLRRPEYARLYDLVHALAVEPLFTGSRWRAIACLNLGWCR